MSLIAVISAIALMAPSFGTSQNIKSVPTFTSHQSQFIPSSDEIENDDADYESFELDSTNLRSVGRWPFGAANAVTYANISGTDYAILGSGGGAYILDITNPGSPIKVGQLMTPGRISGFFIQNNYLYVLDGAGLRIFDISNPQSPFEISGLLTSASCIFVNSNYAYLGDGDTLAIVEVLDPHHPSIVTEFWTGGFINDLFVLDSFAYITNSDSGFQIINVANPVSPQLVGSLLIEDNYFEWLDVSFPYAYATGIDDYYGLLFLRVIDISNPSQPTEVGRQDFNPDYYEYLNDVVVSNNLAFVATDIDLQIIDISQPSSPNLIGNWVGYTGKAALNDSCIFFAAGTLGLRIVNVSDPTSPVLAGFLEIPGSPRGLAMGGSSNEFAYIASGSAGLRILLITDPYHPQEVTACSIPTQAVDVCIRDTIAYVADGSNGIRAISVNNPHQTYEIWKKQTPSYANALYSVEDMIYVATEDSGLVILQDSVILSTFNTEDNAYDVFINGQYAYVAAGEVGLRIINVGDPYLPVEVGYCDTVGYVTALFVSGNYAYLVSGDYGMVIVDVNQPSTPFMVGSYETPDSPVKVYVVGQYAFVTDESGNISVVDVSNPTLPVLVYSFNTLSGYAYDIVVLENRAYVTDDNYQFYVFNNVLDFQPPVEVGSFPVPDQIMQVDIVGSYAYFANDDDGMRIFDVSNPQNPIEISRFDTPRGVLNLTIRDTLAYLGEEDGLRIVNVTNPTSPFEVGFCSLPSDANSVYLLDNYAYIACYSAGLHIIDISDPTIPVEIGFYDTYRAMDVFVVDTLAFVADRTQGLKILSVANHDSIYQIGLIDLDNAYAVEVRGNYAYVVDYGDDRLAIIDVANPAGPVLIGSCPTGSRPMDLSISGDYAYIANRSYGMRVIYILNPNAPNEVGYYDTPGRAQGIKTLGNLAYVADYSCGFVILEFTGPAIAENNNIKMRPTLKISSNPLRPFSTISYSLPQATNVNLVLYDVTGRQVRLLENSSRKQAGNYDFYLKNLSNGIYFLKLETERYKVVKKIVLLN